MLRSLALLLASLVFLASCGPRPERATSTADRLLMIAAGSYDNVKDTLDRLPDGLRRRISWRERPPVPAREVRVVFDEEQRSTSWRIDLTDATDPLSALAGTDDVTARGRANAQDVYRLEGGPLEGTIALVTGRDVSLLSPAYVVNWQKDLLRFTRP